MNDWQESMGVSFRVNAALARGDLPPEFLEEYRLLPERDANSRAVSADLQRIYERLLKGTLGDGFDQNQKPIRFMLSVDDQPNAFIISTATPPIIAFTTGLLAKCKTESELAAVIGHELGHDYFKEILGEARDVGKLEELGADLRVPLILRNADYPQSALRTVMAKLGNEDAFKRIFQAWGDEHPTSANRISALEAVERGLVRASGMGMGEQKRMDDPPLSNGMRTAIRTSRFESHIDGLLTKKRYDAASIEDKVALLDGLIRRELPQTDPYFESRFADVAARLRDLPLSKIDPASRAHVTRLVDTMVNHARIGMTDLNANGRVTNQLYPALQRAYFKDTVSRKNLNHDLRPMGILEDLNDAIVSFKKADDAKSAQTAARKINQLAKDIPFTAERDGEGAFYGGLRKHIQDAVPFDGFAVPREQTLEHLKRPIAPSWDKLARLAKDTQDRDIALALAHLGVVNDPRLQALQSGEPVQKLSPLTTSFLMWRGVEIVKAHVQFDGDGQITGIETRNDDQELIAKIDAERANGEERAKTESKKLAELDWSGLKTDFDGFVNRHKAELTPTLGRVDTPRPFAEAFVRQCKTLLEEDADRYRPKIVQFFTGTQHDFDNRAPLLRSLLRSEVAESSDYSNGSILNGKWGVSPGDPLAQFLLNDPQKLFTPAQKLDFLGFVRRFEVDSRVTDAPEAIWLIDNSRLFDDLPKRTVADLEAWLATVKTDLPKEFETERNGYRPLADVIQFEVLRTVSQLETVDRDTLHRIQDLASFHVEGHSTLRSALKHHVTRLTDSALVDLEPPTDAAEAIDAFQRLASERPGSAYTPSIFSEHGTLRQRYQEAIQTTMASVAAPEQRAELLGSLLFTTTYRSDYSDLIERVAPKHDTSRDRVRKIAINPMQYDGALVDPAFKNWVAAEYADAVTQSLGQDDGSERYASRLKQQVDHIVKEASPAHARDVLERMGKRSLGNVMQLQTGLADYIGKEVERTKPRQAVRYNFHATVGETALETLGASYSTRNATIDFLTEPFHKDGAVELIDKVQKSRHGSSGLDSKFLTEGMSQQAKIDQMELLHKNFWSLPFEARTLAAEQILFRDIERGANEASEIDHSVAYVLDKVMPVAHGAGRRESMAGRSVIESYLDATKNAKDKRLITSAMLVANEPNGAFAGKLSVGKGLGLVLDALGPAGKKLKQAIESHPDTPRSIKAEFKDSKIMAVDPQRSDILQWVEKANHDVPEEQRIVKTGKVLGAGSYGITVEGWLGDGKLIARTILYPHVRESAEHEFTILKDASEALVKRDKRFKSVTDMVRQADAMSAIETDMDMAARQAKVAKDLYSDLSVTIEGVPYTFDTANYLGHGPNHKDFEVVAGQHFNDLAHAAETDVEKAHARGLAKAQITAELHNLLSGRPFDHDVHGGQQKIVGSHIVRFDHGAQSVVEASAREKQMLGHVLGGTIKQHYVKGVPIHEALGKEVDRVGQTPAEKDFLRSVQRGILALGNFQSNMEADELGNVIGAVFASGTVDPAIKSAMRERLGPLSGRAFAELEKTGAASGIAIAANDNSFDLNPDVSALRPPPRESFVEQIPLKAHQIQAGAGLMTGITSFALMLNANRRIAKKKEAGEAITAWDRVQQVGGTIITVGAAAAAVDTLAFGGKGIKTVAGLKDSGIVLDTLAQTKAFFKHDDGKVKFHNVVTVGIGAVVAGGMLLTSHLTKKSEPERPAPEWTSRVSSNRTAQQGARAV